MKVLQAGYVIKREVFQGMNERIEDAARECYQSSHKIGIGTAEALVTLLVKRKHFAMLEHGGLITVKFTVDRGVTHEVVRHRLASFAQESTRYCNYTQDKFDNDVKYIDIREGIELDNKMKQLSEFTKLDIVHVWLDACNAAEIYYDRMIELGASPQIARSVLNNSTKSTITVSANPREWLDSIIHLRTEGVAHPQMREVMIPLAAEFAILNPAIFGAYRTGVLEK